MCRSNSKCVHQVFESSENDLNIECIMFKVIVGNGAFSGVITFSKNELLFIFRNDPFRQ